MTEAATAGARNSQSFDSATCAEPSERTMPQDLEADSELAEYCVLAGTPASTPQAASSTRRSSGGSLPEAATLPLLRAQDASEPQDEDDAPRRTSQQMISRSPWWLPSGPSGCFDATWRCCSRCILLDLTYSYVWSKPLFFLCLFMATAVMGEENLYTNSYLQLIFPSSSSCTLAHTVDICREDGIPMNVTHTIGIPVNYFEDTWFYVDGAGAHGLFIVICVGFVNSRYLEKCWSSLAIFFAALIFLLCLQHTLLTARDLSGCSGSAVAMDWEAFKETWIPKAQQETWTLPPATKLVQEYCDSNSKFTIHKLAIEHQDGRTSGNEPEEEDEADASLRELQRLSASVQDMWVAWMDEATFVIPFSDLDYVKQYCAKLQFLVWHQCIAWLNGTLNFHKTGNRIECNRWDLAFQMDPRTGALAWFHDLEEPANLGGVQGWTGVYDVFALKEMVEKAELQQLQTMGCEALVSGANFGLATAATDFLGGYSPDAIADHLLSLATRGYHCPSDAARHPMGPAQYPGSTDSCMVNPAFAVLETDALENASSVLLHESARNLVADHHFMSCTAKVVSNCAGRARARYLTTFRSATRAILSTLLLVGYSWMWLVRMSRYQQGDLSQRLLETRRQLNSMTKGLRALLTSRVVVGLLVAFMLQLGFTIVAHSAISEWVSEGNGRAIAAQVQLRPRGLVDYLVLSSLWIQLTLMCISIVWNIILHLQLRGELMALPAEVFFGEQPIPIGFQYSGPDIQDLRKMGSTSLVYAMYFPGMVFWHLFYSSWMLVLMFSCLTALVVIVLQPSDDRSPYANQIWEGLTKFTFFLSILMSHFLTRLFTQRCLFTRSGTGMKVRCLCLFTWYEVFFYLISFALGPTAALYDFMKGFLCTMLASLIISKPNFTQFGELADYVYCTYCAALYLERIGEDKYVEDVRVAEAEALWSDSEPMLMDKAFASKRYCCASTLGFWLLFLGIPCIIACLLLSTGTRLGYENPELSPIF